MLTEERQQLIDYMWNANELNYRRFLENPDNEKFELAQYFFHTHTDYGSPKDAILTVDQYVKRAKYMGARSISITDHGTLYAVQPLYKECKKNDLKLIIGVEFYVCDTIEDKSRKKHARLHLCGYAKDLIGYHTLCRLVTDSNDRLIIIPTSGTTKLQYPCISKEMLMRYLGPGSEGHGHVILTSACVGGVLTGINYSNSITQKNLDLLQKSYKEHNEAFDKYNYAIKAIQNVEKELPDLTLIAKKTYGKRRTALKKHPNPDEEAQILKEEEETRRASEKVKELKKILKEAESMRKSSQTLMDKVTKIAYCDPAYFKTFLFNEQKEIESLKAELVPNENLYKTFEGEALWYKELAGENNWYIELQYHGINEEKLFMPYLADIARKNSIPLLAANDAHMEKKEDAEARKFINALRFNKWDPVGPGEDEMYLKDDVSLYQALVSVVQKDAAWEAMRNRKAIADQCDVTLSKVDRYPHYIE